MNIDRLFQVLVVGGSLLAGISVADQQSNKNAEGIEITSAECRPKDAIFCDQPDACVKDACTGELKVKDGFECCWGTKCGDAA